MSCRVCIYLIYLLNTLLYSNLKVIAVPVLATILHTAPLN